MSPLRKEISLKRNVQIGPMAALRDVKGLMQKNRLTAIPVVKDNQLMGMVTLDQVFEQSDNRLACDAMAKEIATVQVDCSLDETLKLMNSTNLDTIPVLDGKKLIGLITIQEIVKELLSARKEVEEYSKSLEEKVKRRTFEISILYELSQKISYTLNYDELFKLILAYLHKVVNYDICTSFLLRGDSADMRIRLARPVDSKIIEQTKALLLDAFDGVSDVKGDERKLTLEVERSEDFVEGHPPLKGELRSFFNVPLFTRDKIIGMINISSLRQNAFSEGDIRLVYTIANQASGAIEKLLVLLKAEKNKIEKAVESMVDGVIMTDEDKKIVVINPAARKALHLDSYQDSDIDFEGISKLLGYDPTELLRKEGKTSIKTEVSIYNASYQAQVSSVLGNEEDVLGTVVALRDISREKEIDCMKSEHISAVTREIADRKRAEEALQKAHDELKMSHAQLVQAEKTSAVGTLVAGVAHEMNNPMTAMLQFAEYCLKNTAEDDRRFPVLKDIERETKRCIDIVQNLLTFSRMEKEGEEDYQQESFAVILDRVLRLLSYRIEKEHISLITHISEETPGIWMKASSMQQVFVNLIGNALDAVEESKDKEIRVEIHREGEFIRVTIADSGPGINSETLKNIYDPFFTTKPVGRGTGLGLPISRSIIEMHGGKMTCDSRHGVGTTFKILFPIERRREGQNE